MIHFWTERRVKQRDSEEKIRSGEQAITNADITAFEVEAAESFLQLNEAWRCIANHTLSQIHTFLLKFSEATAGFKMDEKLFVVVYGQGDPQKEVQAARAFEGIPGKRGGAVDAFECFVSTALLADAKIEERARFCFGLFDLDGEGYLSKEDMVMLLKCCVAVCEPSLSLSLSFIYALVLGRSLSLSLYRISAVLVS